MSHVSEIGNSVRPLTNVAGMSALILKLQNRVWTAPGIGVFNGPPGYGKSMAAVFCSEQHDALYVAVQSEWTKKYFLQQLLLELGQPSDGSTPIPAMVQKACDALASEQRPLIIDEAQYIISRKLTGIIHSLYEGSQVPILLVGEETLPQDLKAHERLNSRVFAWGQALPADFKDVLQLVDMVLPVGLTIQDDMVEFILKRHTGNPRWIVKELSHLCDEARKHAISDISLESWGGLSFIQDTAPVPRGGLK